MSDRTIPLESEDIPVKSGKSWKAEDAAVEKLRYERRAQAEKYNHEYDGIIHSIKVYATCFFGLFFSIIIVFAISTWVLHILMHPSQHWLAPPQIEMLRQLITGGVIGNLSSYAIGNLLHRK